MRSFNTRNNEFTFIDELSTDKTYKLLVQTVWKISQKETVYSKGRKRWVGDRGELKPLYVMHSTFFELTFLHLYFLDCVHFIFQNNICLVHWLGVLRLKAFWGKLVMNGWINKLPWIWMTFKRFECFQSSLQNYCFQLPCALTQQMVMSERQPGILLERWGGVGVLP